MRGLWQGRATDRWSAHPVLGACLRLAVLLVPVVVAIATALLLANTVPLPEGVVGTVGWWAVVLGGSTLALLATDRLARRLLPLAIMLELSLVFPDQAPSRLRAARTISVREMESRLGRLRAEGVSSEPIEAAETLVTLVSILGLHDARTRGHSERVRALTDLISAELDLPEPDRVRLRWAALVHDLGKLTVPTAVLNGGRDLSDDQWDNLRKHPEEGVRLVAGLMPWLGEWGRAVGEHHERWDGTGYPYGRSGEDISYAARIVAVADSFETMTAARSYSKARSAAAAREELTRCAGTQFDPAVVRAFLGISVGKLQWVLGPLTWLAEVPFVAAVDRAGQAVKAGMVTAVVGAFVVFGGTPVPLEADEPQVGPGRDPRGVPSAVGADGALAMVAGDAGSRPRGEASPTGGRTSSFGSLALPGGRVGGPAVQAAAAGSFPSLAGGAAAPLVLIDPVTGRPAAPGTQGALPGDVTGSPLAGLPGVLQPGAPGAGATATSDGEKDKDKDDKDKDKGGKDKDKDGKDEDERRGATPAIPATPGRPGPATPATPATPPSRDDRRDDRQDRQDRQDDRQDDRSDRPSSAAPGRNDGQREGSEDDRSAGPRDNGNGGGGNGGGGNGGGGNGGGNDDRAPGRNDGGRDEQDRERGRDGDEEGAGVGLPGSLPGPGTPALVGVAAVAVAAAASRRARATFRPGRVAAA